jgi:hypothetical protein
MATQAIRCGECAWPVPPEAWNRAEGFRCQGCGQRIQTLVFPAIETRRSGAEPQALVEQTEASCFYHPESRAIIPCDSCGRFLCSLCDIEIDARHLCPKCFELGLAGKRLESAETERMMYDTIALVLATYPALLFWPAIVGAPAAIYVVIRRWRAPLSVVPRTRIRFYLAALFALAEFAFGGYVIWIFLLGFRALQH